jgi:hypothetical protein
MHTPIRLMWYLYIGVMFLCSLPVLDLKACVLRDTAL